MRSGFIKDKSGFSLVELIVIILIMGVITTGTAMSISVVYNANVERAAKKVNNLMKIAHTEAMALEDTNSQIVLRVFKNGDDFYCGVYLRNRSTGVDTEITAEKISNYRVSVSVGSMKTVPSGTPATQEIENEVTYYFRKADGSILKESIIKSDGSVSIYGEKHADPLDPTSTVLYDEAEIYRDIVFTGSSSCTLYIVPGTGRSYFE